MDRFVSNRERRLTWGMSSLTGEVAKNKVVGEGKNKQVTRPSLEGFIKTYW
jgi:hypothetical protein